MYIYHKLDIELFNVIIKYVFYIYAKINAKNQKTFYFEMLY